MTETKVVLEINPRTKEKTTEYLKNINIDGEYTTGQLLESHKELLIKCDKQDKQIKVLYEYINKLINVIEKNSIATNIQIADIKLGGNE